MYPYRTAVVDIYTYASDVTKRWLIDCDPSPYTLEGRPSLQ